MRAPQARVDIALYGTIDPGECASRITEQAEAGVAAFKFSTFGTHPTRFPRINPPLLADAFAEVEALWGQVAAGNRRCSPPHARQPQFPAAPVLAALASSYHHTVGKPMLNSGSVSGWLKRSQRAMRERRRV